MRTPTIRLTDMGNRRCLACGEPVQDVDEEFCDFCLDDRVLPIGDTPIRLALDQAPEEPELISRYDAL